jgi:hypothetical protein
MDQDGPRNESVPEGLLAAVAEANHETYVKNGTPKRSETDPAATGTTGAQSEHKPKPTKQKPDEAVEDLDEENGGDNADGLDTKVYSHDLATIQEQNATGEDEATTEPSQTNTETNTEVNDDWKKALPTAPAPLTLEPPKPDEYGQIDPLDYTTYVTERAKAEMRNESYNQMVITRSFEEAEKVLPELKTDPNIQELVRDTFYAQIANGDPTVVVDIARKVKALLGGAKAQGAQNAKTHIEVQKNVTVESKGATQKKSVTTTPKDKNLDKRLQKGDVSAFEELMGNWMANGKS